jgi:hypothetical protein
VNDYDIRYDPNSDKIREIRHNTLGLIKYISYKIDEDCGYVQGSVMKIYTS